MSTSAATTSSSACDPDYEFDAAWVQAERSSSSPEPQPSSQQLVVHTRAPPNANVQRGYGGGQQRQREPLRAPPGFPVRQPVGPTVSGGESSRAGASLGFQHRISAGQGFQQQQQQQGQEFTLVPHRGGRRSGAARQARSIVSDTASTVSTIRTATTATTGYGAPGNAMVPYEGLQSSPAWGNNVYGVEGLQDEYGIEGFARPNILQLEQEDEDYDDEHPTGFRRANEADLAERAGQPPDSMAS